jgi:uncharacterized protein with PIN domain
MRFLSDTRHLWFLLAILAVGGWGAVTARGRLVPPSFGEKGPYRAEALAEIAARPSLFTADAVCHECHEDVQEERAESLHKSVRCVHCHGLGTQHILQARKAAESPDAKIDPAAEWDGSFMTTIDLFTTQDKRTCLVCHEEAVGMPADFKKINVAAHLEEQAAAEPESAGVCLECHGWHNTAP